MNVIDAKVLGCFVLSLNGGNSIGIQRDPEVFFE